MLKGFNMCRCFNICHRQLNNKCENADMYVGIWVPGGAYWGFPYFDMAFYKEEWREIWVSGDSTFVEGFGVLTRSPKWSNVCMDLSSWWGTLRISVLWPPIMRNGERDLLVLTFVISTNLKKIVNRVPCVPIHWLNHFRSPWKSEVKMAIYL